MRSSTKQWLLPMIPLLLWAAACYTVRYQLMENSRWVDVCYASPTDTICALRSGLGLVIHFQVLPWLALALALPAFLLRGERGRPLAWIALVVALPALALYTVTGAVFALLLALLKLVRAPRQSASVSSAQVNAQPHA